jgi:hypothetical protein
VVVQVDNLHRNPLWWKNSGRAERQPLQPFPLGVPADRAVLNAGQRRSGTGWAQGDQNHSHTAAAQGQQGVTQGGGSSAVTTTTVVP